MEYRRFIESIVVVLAGIGLTTGCSNQDQAAGKDLSSFSSMEEAYAAVDEVLDCESSPSGDPVVPSDGGQLTSEQRLCAENVQVDLYPNENAVQKGYAIWSESEQGEVQIVRGRNWMVVDVTGVAAEEPTAWDIEGLANELNGEYSVAGT
jgi:hypothetical protein